MNGVQKWALVAYLVLCVYFVAKPRPEKLNDRAESLDKRLQGETLVRLAPALADALDMPVASVDCFLNMPESKPSSLVFNKLLVRCGSHSGEENPAEVILDSGVPMNEAMEFFESVEKRVTEGLARMASVPVTSPAQLVTTHTATPSQPTFGVPAKKAN